MFIVWTIEKQNNLILSTKVPCKECHIWILVLVSFPFQIIFFKVYGTIYEIYVNPAKKTVISEMLYNHCHLQVR